MSLIKLSSLTHSKMNKRITRKSANQKEIEEMELNLKIISNETNKIDMFDTISEGLYVMTDFFLQ